MDFYVILGVERDASPAALERAYTRLARRYHPDINPGDSEAAAFFQRVTEAYQTLRNPDRRRSYDVGGEPHAAVQRGSVEFHGFDFSTPVSGASVTFGELFSELLPDASGTAVPDGGGDLHGEITLGFEEALRGAVRQLTVTRLDACAVCGGSGVRRAAERGCAACQGSGTRQWRRGHMVFSKTCEACAGSGRQRQRPCTACGAAGTATVTETITVQVPAGITDGARLRIPGKGNSGPRGGPLGDLYITATVERHPLFERDGDNLTLEVPLGVHEAALGADIRIPTIDGFTTLRVPAGTQSGQRLRLPALGAPGRDGAARGDLIVAMRIVVPRLTDERSRELLREFGRINPTDARRDLFAG